MSLEGHFRQINPLPTLSACPLRSDRVRPFAPQRIDAVATEICRPRLGGLRVNPFPLVDLIHYSPSVFSFVDLIHYSLSVFSFVDPIHYSPNVLS